MDWGTEFADFQQNITVLGAEGPLQFHAVYVDCSCLLLTEVIHSTGIKMHVDS